MRKFDKQTGALRMERFFLFLKFLNLFCKTKCYHADTQVP